MKNHFRFSLLFVLALSIISCKEKATEATEERKEDGHTGTSDKQEEKTVEERKKDVEKALDDDGIPNDDGLRLCS